MAKRQTAMKTFLEKGEKLAEEFPEESLNTLRKFWEAAIKELSERYECEGATNQHTSSNLRKRIPPRLFYYLQHIQSMGNYGSHFQEDGVEPSIEDARYCVYAGQEVMQWIHSETNEDLANEKENFIKVIADAVPCQHCEQPIGSVCLKKNGLPTATNCEHTVRKNAYSSYRRNYQKQYNTTIADAMHELIIELNLKNGQYLEAKDIRKWFDKNYPAYTENAVNSHAMMMATNLKTRHSHPVSKNGDSKYNLFFAENRKFRLYEAKNDPTPLQFGKPNPFTTNEEGI